MWTVLCALLTTDFCTFSFSLTVSVAHKGGGGAAPTNQDLKTIDFVDMKISDVLGDLPFSCNQPLKLADGKYIRIFKSKIKTYDFLDEIKKQSRLTCLLNRVLQSWNISCICV